MRIVHLTASPFYGGPERQMLGLARALPAACRTLFWSFAEGGKSRPFLERARSQGFKTETLVHNTPRLMAAATEVAERLRQTRADVLCCHGYKADLVGWRAARRVGIPVVAVSRGWTWATLKVRCYEFLDRLVLHGMDRVVCVSEEQARRVRRALVDARKIRVLRNAIDLERFTDPDPTLRDRLQGWFAVPPSRIVGAVGRLSPEKGIDVLLEAAAQVIRRQPDTGFVVFGEGPQRTALERRIDRLGLAGRFLLAGFREDVDRWLPTFDLLALPSFTEGLPNAALEALAAQVPVVATAVGGTPEVIRSGESGLLVPSGDPASLAEGILEVLGNAPLRRTFAGNGWALVREEFSFAAQARGYLELFADVLRKPLQGRDIEGGSYAEMVRAIRAPERGRSAQVLSSTGDSVHIDPPERVL